MGCGSRAEQLSRAGQESFRKHRFAQSLALARGALEREACTPAQARDLAVLAAWSLQQLRRYDDCHSWLAEARAAGWIPADDPEAALVLLWIRWSEGSYRDVLQAADEFLAGAAGRLDAMVAEYLFLRGSARSRVGQLAGAVEDCEAARSLYLVLGQEERRAEACNALGAIALQQSRYERALRWLEESLKVNEALGLQRRLGDNCLNIGIARYKRGELPAARLALQRALETTRQPGGPHLRCRALLALGNVCRLEGDRAAARAHLAEAYDLAAGKRLAREEAIALEFLGDLHRDERQPAEALRWYARAEAIADRISPGGDLAAEIGRRRGECLLALGRATEARRALEQARDLSRRLEDRFEEAAALRALAALQTGDPAQAARLLGRAAELFEEIEATGELALTHLEAARLAEAEVARGGGDEEPLVERALRQALLADRLFKRLDLEEGRRQADAVVDRLARRHLEGVLRRRAGEEAPRRAAMTPATRALTPPGRPTRPQPAGPRPPRIVAASAPMRAALQQADAYAPFDEAVLIRGETGTGKDLVARRIHQNSSRRDGPFVAVNCAAVPPTLFEREFFGNRRGAYTGAEADTPGYVAQAEGGTLLLDEIGELPWELQAKLLRLLQDGTYSRLGDPAEHRADIRLVAATNADLDALVAARRFRQDLHFRLRTLEIVLPPLRERPDDVLPLLQHFLDEFGAEGRPADYFDARSLRLLRGHGWPGNVREVQMVARRAHIGLASEGRVRIALDDGRGGRPLLLTGPDESAAGPDPARLTAALAEAGGNKAEAARLLGVSRMTLYRWLRRYAVEA